jgi:hypothetical protein
MDTNIDIDFPVKEYREIRWDQLDEMVAKLFDRAYSSLESDEYIKNDTYLKFTRQSYDSYVSDPKETEAQITRWAASDKGPAGDYYKEHLRQRDEMFHPHWTLMLAWLIQNGHLPEGEYLFKTEW